MRAMDWYPLWNSLRIAGISCVLVFFLGILIAYYAWNEFLYAIIFIDSDKFRTIPAGLMNLRDALQTDWGVLLAGMTISATPLVLLFLLMQKQFIRGMTAGAVKG